MKDKEHFKMSDKTYKPVGGWRHNHLSNKPGGSTIIVNYEGYNVEYNNIKYLSAYINAIVDKDNAIQSILLKDTDEIIWSRDAV